jgi:hypothetical protein
MDLYLHSSSRLFVSPHSALFLPAAKKAFGIFSVIAYMLCLIILLLTPTSAQMTCWDQDFLIISKGKTLSMTVTLKPRKEKKVDYTLDSLPSYLNMQHSWRQDREYPRQQLVYK